MQECIRLCEKLKQELEEASCIPGEKLYGTLAEALKEVRKYQKAKTDEISRVLISLEERL